MHRSRRISPRFTAADHARLTAAAAAAGLTVTRWLHRVATFHLDALPGVPAPSLPPPPSATPPAAVPPLPEAAAGSLRRTAATRFSPDQHAVIAERAQLCGLTVAAYLRLLALGSTPVARRSEVRSAIVAINRVGNNLNQLMKLANSGLVLQPDLLRETAALRGEIDALRQAFLAALRGQPDDGDNASP